MNFPRSRRLAYSDRPMPSCQRTSQNPPATTEDVEIAAVRIALETLLNLQRQPLHAATHVRVPSRDPDTTSRRNGDDDRSAFNVAAINADEAFAPIPIRTSFVSTPRSHQPRLTAAGCRRCRRRRRRVLHDHLREATGVRLASCFPSPLIDQAGANIGTPRDLCHDGARLLNRRQNLRAFFNTPTTAALSARDQR